MAWPAQVVWLTKMLLGLSVFHQQVSGISDGVNIIVSITIAIKDIRYWLFYEWPKHCKVIGIWYIFHLFRRMVPMHKSKPGLILGESWSKMRSGIVLMRNHSVSVLAFVLFGYAVLFGVRIELQKLAREYENQLTNRTFTNDASNGWTSINCVH